MHLVLFTKHLKTVADLSLSEAADRVAAWGFDGADLTVRDGGYVDPETVTEALPAAVATFEDRGLSVPMITTRITGATERAERAFAAADDCGVAYCKLGYWHYDGLGTLDEGLATMRADLEAVGSLASEYDVTPVVHVHSGSHLTGSGVLLADLLAAVDGVAAYPDLGHLAVEGGRDGWRTSLERLAPHAAVVGVKDYGWRRAENEWAARPAPLGEGLVDWADALDYLDASGFDGPFSLHAEYDVPFDDLVERIQADRAFLRALAN